MGRVGQNVPVLATAHAYTSNDHQTVRPHAERCFQAAFEHAPIGVAIIALAGSQRGRCIETNPALAQLIGLAPHELEGRPLADFVAAGEDADIDTVLGQLDAGDAVTQEVRLRHRDGHEIWTTISCTPVPAADGASFDLCVTQVLDISERRRFEGQLQYLADHDSLTGLFNRHRFEEELGRVLAETQRYERRAALLMLDLDGFKEINDRFGHPVGDELVTRVGQLLATTVRSTDVVARLGGDEFAVILLEASHDDARKVADNILAAVRRHGIVVRDARHGRVTASIGITTFGPRREVSDEELIVEADIAMYDAKAAGRDRYAIYAGAPQDSERISERRSWLARLREAVDNDLFVLEAQPITSFAAGAGAHFELLLRMRGRDGQLIPPGGFLHHAERLDLMGEIDRWVLGRAVRLLHDHHRAGNDISVAVNLSGKTMNDLAIADDLAVMMEQHPFPAGRLVVEVTETAAIVNIDRAGELARDLRRLGCRFALDDFGAGFASFYYLKHLDFDYLKIDGEFIEELTRSQTDQLVVRAVVEIAKGLDTATVAEFVSDDDPVTMLRDLGVNYGQGFHLGKPGPLDSTLPPLIAPVAVAA